MRQPFESLAPCGTVPQNAKVTHRPQFREASAALVPRRFAGLVRLVGLSYCSSLRGLTLPSNGQSQAGFAHL